MMEVLYTDEQIKARVAEMARAIDAFYEGRQFTLLALVNGATFFAVDLARALKGQCLFDTLAASSYVGEHSTGNIRIRGGTKMTVEDRHVLLVDGVFDSGLTLCTVRNHLQRNGAKTVNTAVLASKAHERHEMARDFTPDWIGFDIPDLFVVGCGMDANELYRNLPYIGVVRQ